MPYVAPVWEVLICSGSTVIITGDSCLNLSSQSCIICRHAAFCTFSTNWSMVPTMAGGPPLSKGLRLPAPQAALCVVTGAQNTPGARSPQPSVQLIIPDPLQQQRHPHIFHLGLFWWMTKILSLVWLIAEHGSSLVITWGNSCSPCPVLAGGGRQEAFPRTVSLLCFHAPFHARFCLVQLFGGVCGFLWTGKGPLQLVPVAAL